MLYQVPSVNRLRAYWFTKHHVVPGSRGTSLEEVGNSLVGIHSARLSTPYVALRTRVDDFRPTTLRSLVYDRRQAMKLRCMRGTLHIVPNELAPVVHGATLQLRLRSINYYWTKLGISEKKRLYLASTVREAATGGPRSSAQLLTRMACSVRRLVKLPLETRILIGRLAIKEAWERGSLCYLNSSIHWGKEIRNYGSTEILYPKLDLNGLCMAEAVEALVYAHIGQYGPVTSEDISWWSGLGVSRVKGAIDRLGSKIERVRVNGFNYECYMTAYDVQKIRIFKEPSDDWIELLAYEDPSLKGYFTLRHFYADNRVLTALFNRIGEARASIVSNGEIVGTWTWNHRSNKIETVLLKEIKAHQKNELKERIASMTIFLSMDKTDHYSKSS